jgi:glycosyltransferase involved in cell wall biosynthesis
MLTVGRDKPAVSLDEAGHSTDGSTVAVIIPTYNHARFIGEAIKSVLAQTRPADEIIVVDDGSTDNLAAVVVEFPTVRLLRQGNHGRSVARNTGLRNCKSNYVVFLDADDRLLPNALEAGLACMATHFDCGFVYGGYRIISEDGRSLSGDIVNLFNGDGYLAFLRQNLAGSPMTVLFRRDCLLAINGFDEACVLCEDYDVYLRLARRHPIASYPTIIAEYRRHGQNTSNDNVAMLKAGLLVLKLEARIANDPAGRAAAREGRATLRRYYVTRMIVAAFGRWRENHDIANLVKEVIRAARWSPYFVMRALLGFLYRRAISVAPPTIAGWMKRLRGRHY